MKKSGNKLISVLVALCMVLVIMPQLALTTAAMTTARTTALDLTAITTNIVNPEEGWAWYYTGDEGYDDKTLVLGGLNLVTSDADALKLPADATIVLADGSENTVTSTYSNNGHSHGIHGFGSLTIQGSGTLDVAGGNPTNENGSMGILMEYAENELLTIKDGATVSASGGDTQNASYGIKLDGFVDFSNATVTAAGGTARFTCGLYAGSVDYSGSSTFDSGTVLTVSGGIGGTSIGMQLNRNGAGTIAVVENGAAVTATSGPQNNISVAGNYSAGISMYGKDLEVKSGGSVTAACNTDTRADINSLGIEGGILLNGGTVNASGGYTIAESCGVKGNVQVNSGELTAIGGNGATGSYGIYSIDPWSLNFAGGTTIAKSGTSSRPFSVYTSSITTTGMSIKRYVDGAYSGDLEFGNESGYKYIDADNIKISLPAPSFAESGNGSEDAPYEIGNADQLKELSEFVNTQNEIYGDKCYELTDDIVLNDDLSGSPEQWTPIGADEESFFTGVFDGNGHTISGLYINDTEGELDFAGLFGPVMGASVKNLGLIDGSITAVESATGGIVAFGAGTHIENCYNSCTISASGNDAMAGGIIGVNSESGLTVVNCYNTGSVTVAVSEDGDEACAGGIVGLNIESAIRNCYSTGAITGNASGGAVAYTGGIVGQNDLESEAVIERNYYLDSAAVNGIGYDETEGTSGDAGCTSMSGIEMKSAGFVNTLNGNVTALEDDYPNLSPWRSAGAAENGGYPVFGIPAATFTLTVEGGGAGATVGGDYEEGESVPVSAGTRSGYTFSGWTTSGGGTFASAGSANTIFTMPSSAVTITANWTENSTQHSNNTPHSPAADSVLIIVNGQSQTAGTSTATTDSNGQTTTTVTVDTSKLQAILDAQESGATVIIPVAGGSNVAAGTLTGAMVKSMESKNATLVVQTDSGNYTLPASQINIDAVSQQFGGNVSLSDITVTVSISEPSAEMVKVMENAAEDGGYMIMVPVVDYTITCTYGGQTVSVSSFNAYVERTIAIPDGVDPAKITTGVVVDSDGTVHHVPTQIVLIDGKYYAVINSLTNSAYSVIWNPVEFSDVTNHWAKDSVNNMGSRMVVSGTGGNRYEPDRNMTRAEFAAIIVKALGLEPEKGEIGFHDVFASDWYRGYIETAASYSIINGYKNGNFGPNDTVTREQAMTMLARAMKLTGLESGLTDHEISSLTAVYTDGASVSDYAKQGAVVCLNTGIVNGRGKSTIAPKDHVTRAEVAVMVEHLLKNSGLI